MHRSELEEAILAGEVLMHGCSLDNLANILVDDTLRSGLRKHAGPSGVSLTTSIDIARQFCRTHEDEFDEVLHGWYGVSDEREGVERQGAILVFTRSSLSDLTLVPFLDIDSYDEQEERVIGDVDRVHDRLVAILVGDADVRWFETVVDEVFRAMAEPADAPLAAIEAAQPKFAFIKDPSMALPDCSG